MIPQLLCRPFICSTVCVFGNRQWNKGAHIRMTFRFHLSELGTAATCPAPAINRWIMTNAKKKRIPFVYEAISMTKTHGDWRVNKKTSISIFFSRLVLPSIALGRHRGLVISIHNAHTGQSIARQWKIAGIQSEGKLETQQSSNEHDTQFA